MKTLVVYFSYTGNTENIANRIATVLNADTEKLEMMKPYDTNYQIVVEQVQNEVGQDYKPTLKSLKHDFRNYDRIIIGTPTFWYKMAPAVLTFLSSNDLTGKSIVPFMTNAGWPGTVIEDMISEAKKNGAMVQRGKEIKFHTQTNGITTDLVTSEKELSNWINSLI